MESKLRRHTKSPLSVIEAKFEVLLPFTLYIPFHSSEFFDLRSHRFYHRIVSRRRQHRQAGARVQDGAATGIDVPDVRGDVQDLSVDGDSGQLDAVVAAVSPAGDEFSGGGGADGSGCGGGEGLRGGGAEDEVANGGYTADVVGEAVGEAAADVVFGGFVDEGVDA